MNILILGGGYIGTHLIRHLGGRHTIQILTKKIVDYTSLSSFSEYLRTNKFDIAVNCSGYTGKPNVDACEDDKENCWNYNAVYPARTAITLNSFGIPFIQISSGCIYQGPGPWTEEDTPNFGMYERDSSFYSKSKHAGELALANLSGFIFRIRMPFCDTGQRKNILVKYLEYDNIASQQNSVTSVIDLCDVIEHFCQHRDSIEYGIYNVVNKGSVDAESVLELLKKQGLENPNWNIVPIDTLDLKAIRSNCTLSGDKLNNYYEMPTAAKALKSCTVKLRKFKERSCQDTEKV